MQSWAVEELIKLNEIQPEIVESALQHLWKIEPHIYKSIVISAYIDEKISLSKAAQLLGITRIELEREFTEKGIPLQTALKKRRGCRSRGAKNMEVIVDITTLSNFLLMIWTQGSSRRERAFLYQE